MSVLSGKAKKELDNGQTMRSELVPHCPGLAWGGAGHQGAREGGGWVAGRLQGDQGARPGRAVVLLPAGRAQGEGLLEEELGMGVLLRAGDCFWPPGCWEGGREPGILVMGLEGVTGWGAGPGHETPC